jgi:hypothetical protein
MNDPEMLAWINGASLVDLLRKWRFARPGDPFFQGFVGEHYSKVMFGKRATDPEAWVNASKQVGWDAP